MITTEDIHLFFTNIWEKCNHYIQLEYMGSGKQIPEGFGLQLVAFL